VVFCPEDVAASGNFFPPRDEMEGDKQQMYVKGRRYRRSETITDLTGYVLEGCGVKVGGFEVGEVGWLAAV
jgi:hypothetical protein